MSVKSVGAGKLALLAVCFSTSVSAQTISTRPLDAAAPNLAAVPVDNPLALAALFLLLVFAGWWSLRRSHVAQRVVSLVMVAALAGVAGHSSGLMAQVLNAFTNSSGESLSIGVVPITAGGFTGFQPADFSNASGVALKIDAIDPPNQAECFATQPANTLLPPGVPVPSPHPACAVGATLASNAICRIDVEAICRALAPEPGPTLTAVSPDSGSAMGGTLVTVTGTGLSSATAISFGGVAATISAITATSITAMTPPHPAGTVDVAVTTAGGTTQAPSSYTFVAAPTLTQISPSMGTISGGTMVTLTGTALSSATAVTFDGIPVPFAVITPTTIAATTPAHPAGTVTVSVTTAGGTTQALSSYTFVAAPAVPQVSPSVGPTAGGTLVTLTGTGLSSATNVIFGGVAVSSTVVDANTITVVTPAHAPGVVDVAVTTPGGMAQALQSYTFALPPTVGPISPPVGSSAGGTTVTVTGTGLSSATGITFGGLAATVVANTPTSITAITPAHAAGIVDVLVTTPGGTAQALSGYTYVEAPVVIGILPAYGPASGGSQVMLYGTGLSSATSVTFGGVPASFVIDGSAIRATSPPHAERYALVVVTTPGGTAIAGQFLYISP